jgi:type IX secretion system PorP/SprF family membrane protein
MRKLLKRTGLAVAIALSGAAAHAQVDPHFTQFYVYPSWLNPALTGVFDGNIRISGIYRSQWANVSAFNTPGISVDVNTEKNINFGGSVMRQSAGNGGYNYTTAYGNVAYTGVKFGPGFFKRVVFGIQAGLIDRRFDPTKLTYGSMWNPVTGQVNQPSGEMLARNSSMSFDAGAGVLYYDAQPGKKANFYGGFAASHLTRPEDHFRASGKERLPVRMNAHAGIRININDRFSITPNALYVRQGNASIKMLGAYAQFKAFEGTELMLGGNYRFDDAFAPFLGFTYGNFLLGASYDINNSDLGRMVNGVNTFEISLTFIGRKSVKTPEAEFVCPRL